LLIKPRCDNRVHAAVAHGDGTQAPAVKSGGKSGFRRENVACRRRSGPGRGQAPRAGVTNDWDAEFPAHATEDLVVGTAMTVQEQAPTLSDLDIRVLPILQGSLFVVEEGAPSIMTMNTSGWAWEDFADEQVSTTPMQFTEWPVDFEASVLSPELRARYLVNGYNWSRMMHPISPDRRAYEAAVLGSIVFMCCDRAEGGITQEQIAAREVTIFGIPLEECLDCVLSPLGATRERWKREFYTSLYMNLAHVSREPTPLYRAWTQVAKSSYLGYLRVRNIDGVFAFACVFSLCLGHRDSVVVDEEVMNLVVECTVIAHDVLTYPKHTAEGEIFSLVHHVGNDAIEGLLFRAANLLNRICQLSFERGLSDIYRNYALGIYGLRWNN
jgi:hypothetical protein